MSDEIDEMLSGPAPEAEEAVQPEQAEATEGEQPEADAAAPEDQPEAPKEEQMVPLSVLKSTRDDLRQQLDELKRQFGSPERRQQPQQEPAPDMFQDPAAYTHHMQMETQRAILSAKADLSQTMAEEQFGTEAVQEALEAAKQAGNAQQFLNDPHPYGKLMKWYQTERVAREIGSDPEAYKAKLEQEIRQKIEAEMAAKQVGDMARKTAPSLAGVNGSGGNSDPGWQGPTDLNSLIGE